MLCRILFLLAMVLGLSGFAQAQPPGDEGFDSASEQDGSPREMGGRGEGEEGFRGRGGFGGRGPRPNPLFTALDGDGDGMISARELRRAAANLKELDADGDGNISLEEVTPQRGPGGDPAQMLDRLMENDADGDGMLSQDEVPELMARMLTGADLNADGFFDKEELGKAMQNIRGRGPGGPGGPGGGFGGPGGGFSSDPDAMTKQILAGDQNGDGMLSPDEVSPQAMGMLKNADTNGDGHLNAKEVRMAMEMARQRFQRYGGGRGFQGGQPGAGGPQGAGQSGTRGGQRQRPRPVEEEGFGAE